MSTLSQATAQLEAHFVHPWSEDDKGKLDAQGHVLRKCTLGFLDGLLETLLGRGGKLDDDPSGPYADRIKNLMNSIFHEIRRLQLHPGLYPHHDAGVLFVHTIKQVVITKSEGFQVTRLITDPEIWKSFGTVLGVEDLHEQLNQRQPVTLWEKFLFPGSSESGLSIPPTTRVVPPGGTKILSQWHRSATRMVRLMQAASTIKAAELAEPAPAQPQVDEARHLIDIHTDFDFQLAAYRPNPIYQGGWTNSGMYEQLEIPHMSELINGKLGSGLMYQPSRNSMKCVYITPR